MSVFAIGKICFAGKEKRQLQSELEKLAQRSAIDLRLGVLVPEDEAVFNESALLRRPGVVFNAFSPGEDDVGSLWEEAAGAANNELQTTGDPRHFSTWEQVESFILPDRVRSAVEQTRFGVFISGLFKMHLGSSRGFAIFDNGIDQMVEREPDICQDLIFKAFLVNWDLGPNALFVWRYK